MFYGKDSELTGSDREHQEVSMLALHLLQSALVHVNTLLVQEVLADSKWAQRLTDDDRRALSPLFWTHINPYGTFDLDMNTHLDLAAVGSAHATGPGWLLSVLAAATSMSQSRPSKSHGGRERATRPGST